MRQKNKNKQKKKKKKLRGKLEKVEESQTFR